MPFKDDRLPEILARIAAYKRSDLDLDPIFGHSVALLRVVYARAALMDPLHKVDEDLTAVAGPDRYYGSLLQAARDLDAEHERNADLGEDDTLGEDDDLIFRARPYRRTKPR